MHANVGKGPDARTVDGCAFGGAQGVEGSQRGASRGRRRGREEQEGELLFIDLEILSCREHMYILDLLGLEAASGSADQSEREHRTLVEVGGCTGDSDDPPFRTVTLASPTTPNVRRPP